MQLATLLLLPSLATLSQAAVLWDGRFNSLTSATDLNEWSWSNQVGPYQYYIHRSEPVRDYIALSPSYKNPADSSSKQGVKIRLDGTAYWNGQNMRRTELIPQTGAATNQGKVYYHFSMMRSATGAPSVDREHQICFFESHFTEIKYRLQWMVAQQSRWSVDTWEPGVWHNNMDFSANTVGFWHSTGSDALTRVVAPVSASTSSNGEDWHLGVLELQRSGYPDTNEDFYFSGVYIESGTLTASVSGPTS